MNNIKNMKRNVLPDRVISVSVILIYSFLIVFGIYSMTHPKWLVDVSFENKKQEVSSLVYLGIELSRKHQEKQAIEKFDEALSMIPNFVEAIVNKGVSYKRLKMYSLAVKEFEKALSLSPFDSSNIYSNLKDIYIETGDTTKAEIYFKKAFMTSHSTVDKYMKKGIYYYNMKNLDSALASYKQALIYRQKMLTYYNDVLEKEKRNENINYALWVPNDERALKLYDSVGFKLNLNMDRGLAENYNKIGFVIALKGEYDKALVYFFKAIKIWKDYPDANANIRYIYEKMNNVNSHKF